MSVESYMQDWKNLIFNTDNVTTNLFDKLYTETEKHNIKSIYDESYEYKTVKGDFNKRDFQQLQRITAIYSKLVVDNDMNRDIYTVVQYNDKFFVFEQMYSPTMPQFISIKEDIDEEFITICEMLSEIQKHVPKEDSWTKEVYYNLIY